MHVGILNERYEPEEEFIVEHCSGAPMEHSDRVDELLPDHSCQAGHWVVIIDGDVVSESEFTAHTIHWP